MTNGQRTTGDYDRRSDRSGTVWAWILGILGVLVLLFLVIIPLATREDIGGPEPDAADVPGVAGIDEDRPLEPITDVRLLVGVEPETLVGKEVILDPVRVQQIVGDRIFWIGAGNAERILVVAEPEPLVPGNEAIEAVLTAGDQVRIEGDIERIPDPLPDEWNIGPEEREALKREPFYISANSVRLSLVGK